MYELDILGNILKKFKNVDNFDEHGCYCDCGYLNISENQPNKITKISKFITRDGLTDLEGFIVDGNNRTHCIKFAKMIIDRELLVLCFSEGYQMKTKIKWKFACKSWCCYITQPDSYTKTGYNFLIENLIVKLQRCPISGNIGLLVWKTNAITQGAITQVAYHRHQYRLVPGMIHPNFVTIDKYIYGKGTKTLCKINVEKCRFKQNCNCSSSCLERNEKGEFLCDNRAVNAFCSEKNCGVYISEKNKLCGNWSNGVHFSLEKVEMINPPIGFGLVANTFIPKDTVIGIYYGELRLSTAIEETADRKFERGDNLIYTANLITGAVVIDPEHQGNDMRLINHSCMPNSEFQTDWNLNGFKAVVVVTLENIEPSSLVTLNYFKYNADHTKYVPPSIFRCVCESHCLNKPEYQHRLVSLESAFRCPSTFLSYKGNDSYFLAGLCFFSESTVYKEIFTTVPVLDDIVESEIFEMLKCRIQNDDKIRITSTEVLLSAIIFLVVFLAGKTKHKLPPGSVVDNISHHKIYQLFVMTSCEVYKLLPTTDCNPSSFYIFLRDQLNIIECSNSLSSISKSAISESMTIVISNLRLKMDIGIAKSCMCECISQKQEYDNCYGQYEGIDKSFEQIQSVSHNFISTSSCHFHICTTWLPILAIKDKKSFGEEVRNLFKHLFS